MVGEGPSLMLLHNFLSPLPQLIFSNNTGWLTASLILHITLEKELVWEKWSFLSCTLRLGSHFDSIRVKIDLQSFLTSHNLYVQRPCYRVFQIKCQELFAYFSGKEESLELKLVAKFHWCLNILKNIIETAQEWSWVSRWVPDSLKTIKIQ